MASLDLMENFIGGSLTTIIPENGSIIKLYNGPIPRGAEKLIHEYKWLEEIPNKLYDEYPLLFPKPISIESNIAQNNAKITISKIPRISLSKYILEKKIKPKQVMQGFESSMYALLNVVYPLRSGTIRSSDGYYHYHAKRIALARKYLRQLPYFKPMLEAKELIVNGIPCPTINHFLSWLDDNFNKIFISNKLVAVHANFHFDNILINLTDEIKVNDISFIDPRGDLVGYPHYDFAKILTSIESYYDEIHYNMFELKYDILGNSYSIDISIDSQFSYLYTSCFNSLEKWIDQYSHAEEIDRINFLAMVHTVHCIHILSFTFYHAYQKSSKPDRIRAYISVLGLLCKRLIKLYDNKNFDFIPTGRLMQGDNYGTQ